MSFSVYYLFICISLQFGGMKVEIIIIVNWGTYTSFLAADTVKHILIC